MKHSKDTPQPLQCRHRSIPEETAVTQVIFFGNGKSTQHHSLTYLQTIANPDILPIKEYTMSQGNFPKEDPEAR